MFWKTQFPENTSLHEALDRSEIDFDEVLDDSYMLQEMKGGNRKLVDYFISQANRLVETALTPPVDDDYMNKDRYKRNHFASEAVSCNMEVLTEALFADDNVIQQLSTFLHSVPPEDHSRLNPLTASFYAKIMTTLMAKRPASMLDDPDTFELGGGQDEDEDDASSSSSSTQIFDLVTKRMPTLLDDLLAHIGVSAVMDVLYRLVTLPESEADLIKLKRYLLAADLMPKLIGQFTAEAEPEVVGNVSYLWSEWLRTFRDVQYTLSGEERAARGPDPLLEALQSQSSLTGLLDQLITHSRDPTTGDVNDGLIENGLNIFVTLLQTAYFRKNPSELAEKACDPGSAASTTVESDETAKQRNDEIWTPDPDHVVERSLASKIVQLYTIFDDETPSCSSSDTVQLAMGSVRRLGAGRLSLVRTLAHLLNTNHGSVHEVLIGEPKLLKDIVGLIPKYSWNNFLHAAVGQCVTCILFSSSNDDVSAGDSGKVITDLLTVLFKESGLLELILSECRNDPSESVGYGGVKVGFTAHLYSIARMIQSARLHGNNSEVINEILGSSLAGDLSDQWDNFVEVVLKPYEEQNQPDEVDAPVTGLSSFGSGVLGQNDDIMDSIASISGGLAASDGTTTKTPEEQADAFDRYQRSTVLSKPLSLETAGLGQSNADNMLKKCEIPSFENKEFEDSFEIRDNLELPDGESAFEAMCSAKFDTEIAASVQDDPFGIDEPDGNVTTGWAEFEKGISDWPATNSSIASSSHQSAKPPLFNGADIDDSWADCSSGGGQQNSSFGGTSIQSVPFSSPASLSSDNIDTTSSSSITTSSTSTTPTTTSTSVVSPIANKSNAEESGTSGNNSIGSNWADFADFTSANAVATAAAAAANHVVDSPSSTTSCESPSSTSC